MVATTKANICLYEIRVALLQVEAESVLGDVKAVDNYHLLFPCPFMQAYLTHWYKVGPLYPSMAYVTVYRLPGPLLLHRLASALQVKDPHTLPPSNVPELH